MSVAVIHTDGAYTRSRDVGGWAALIDVPGDQANIAYGRVRNTTSNRMEMVAIIRSLRAVKKSDAALVFTDSELTVKCFNGEYDIKANLDLWEDLTEQTKRLSNVILKYLPRNSVPQLEECDRLAKMMTDKDCRTPEFSSYGAIPPAAPEETTPDKELSEIVAAARAGGEPDGADVDGWENEGGGGESITEDTGEVESDAAVGVGSVEPDDADEDDEPDDPSHARIKQPTQKRRNKERRSKTKIGVEKT